MEMLLPGEQCPCCDRVHNNGSYQIVNAPEGWRESYVDCKAKIAALEKAKRIAAEKLREAQKARKKRAEREASERARAEERRTKEEQERNTREDETRQRDGYEHREISCPNSNCNRKMRISVNQARKTERCAACSVEFSVYLDNDGNVYVESGKSEGPSDEDFEIKTAEDSLRLLQLQKGASADEIKKAFFQRMNMCHTDKNGLLSPRFQKVATAEAVRLNKAKAILRAEGYWV